MGVLLRAAWRSHRAHPLLALLAVAGIALGVAVSTAIALANDAARHAFAVAVEGVVGRATHQVVAGSAGLDETAYPALRAIALAHGGAAAPVVEAEVALPRRGDGGRPALRSARLLGLDPFAEGPFRAGTAFADRRALPLGRLLTEPGAAVLCAASAETLGQGAGSTLAVRHGTRAATLAVVGVAPDDGGPLARVGNLVVVDLATAQEVLGRPGRLDRIDLLLPDAAAEAAVAAALPPGCELVPAARRGDSLRQLTSAFHANLTALGLIALVVGMFLIANTAGFAVVRRRALFARLRAHGATPGQILALVLGEAAVAGLAAALAGTALGVLLARVLLGLVTRTIGDLYAALPPVALVIEPAVLVQGVALGVLATVLAAALPAWEAARTRPRLALLASGPDRAVGRALPWLAAAGLGLFALCGALLAWAPPGIAIGFAALGAGVVGAALLVPPLLVPLVRVLALPMRSPVGRLAARAVGTHLARTGLAVAALAIACAAALGMTLMVSSFRHALDSWLAGTLTADVYVSGPRLVAARIGDVPLPPPLVQRLLAVDGIAEAVPKRDAQAEVRIAGRALTVQVVAFEPLPGARKAVIARPPFAGPAEYEAAWAALAGGAAFITEPFAARHGLKTGDTIALRTPGGDRPLVVAAVVADYSSDQGFIYLDRARWREWFADDAVTALALTAVPGVAADELAARLTAAAGDAPAVVTPGAALARASLQVFDRTFAITALIRWMAAGVAVLGLVAALAAVQLERARTTARLRAVGMTPAEVLRLGVLECLLAGAAAGILAVPIGIGLAVGLIQVINRRSFGWSMDLVVDPWQVLLTVVLAAGAAVIAGALPAWRAGRRPLMEALHAE